MRKLVFLLLISCISSLYAVDWPPVNPADLALKQPKVEKDADAEVILWEVRMLDEMEGSEPHVVQNHYVRLKIFTERGRDKYSTVDISFGNKIRISDIAGRAIKANGEVVELKKDAVYERVLAKAGGLKVKVKSFAIPGVEPGGIIEYRWRETIDKALTDYVHLQFSRDIPVQQVKYFIKPLVMQDFSYGMRSIAFNMPAIPFVKEDRGFVSTTATNIPAFKAEPDMPAESQVRPWILIYYSPDNKDAPDKFWEKFGKTNYNDYKSRIKVSDEMRTAAAEVVSGAKTPEEKVEKIYGYVRKTIKNATYSEDLTAQDREKLKKNNNTADTFKQRAGWSREVSLLFIALLSSLDFDARLTASADRNNGIFDKRFANSYFLNTYNVAVKIGEKWVFCDPSYPYLPFGMLRWQEEGMEAMISDPKAPAFSLTPISPSSASRSTRTATFKLNEDGELEGDVRIQHAGHAAVNRKWTYQEQAAAEREESVKQSVKERFAEAEVTAVKLENELDPQLPLIISYHVKIPGYAQRTGRRLFLKPAYFHRDFAPRYTASDRKFPLNYDYAWSERDEITINLPEGFALEKASMPGGFAIGKFGDYLHQISVTNDQKKLVSLRTFEFGKDGSLSFAPAAYDPLKKVFNQVQEGDDHLLTLQRKEQ